MNPQQNHIDLLRMQIFRAVMEIGDPNRLEQLYALVQSDGRTAHVEKSDEELALIDAGLEDVKAGRTRDHAEVWPEMLALLNQE